MLFGSAFLNSGQVCIAIKRLYVPDALYDAMCEELAALADAAVVGNGLEPGIEMGPLQNRMQFDRVRELLDDARAHGKVIAGGQVAASGRGLLPAADHRARHHRRHAPRGRGAVRTGPARHPLHRRRRRHRSCQCLALRARRLGLGSDVARAHAVAEKLQAGTVWVNKHLDITPDVPFSGCRQSGVGTELGLEGLREFTQRRVINLAK